MDNSKELSFEQRAAHLVSQMTLEEKIRQVGTVPPAIPRLGIPDYHFTNEASHGLFLLNFVNKNKYDVTSFPVCLSMSQSWDTEKVKSVAAVISDEARAYSNERGETLNFFSPTVNMGRDPRNGRADEAFGEDPLLAGKMAAHYIQGIQGDDEKYLKAGATAKHFALNSSENNRHTVNANADVATIREYYAKVFEYAVEEGNVQSIMTSYNRVNGVPSSANDFLLTTLLREEWGFHGFVVSDGGAVADTFINPVLSFNRIGAAHYYAEDELEASSITLTAGTDMSCGTEHINYLKAAIDKGLISEDILDRAAIRNLTSRFRLGLFDDPRKVPFTKIGMEHVCSEYNQKTCVDMANDCIVLLKNERQLLPIDTNSIKSILVVGPNAKFRQLGGYSCGTTNRLIDTPVNIMTLDGIRNAVADTNIHVNYEKGWCIKGEFSATGPEASLPGVDIVGMYRELLGVEATENEIMASKIASPRYQLEDPDYQADDSILFARALRAAEKADLIIMVVGTDDGTASEENDREDLTLPYGQNEKVKAMLAANPNTVVILTTPGMVTGDCLDEAHTLVYPGFAGEAQGTAIANVLFGKVNPNAKTTTTWYKDQHDMPLLDDYGLKKQDTCDHTSRTYLYYDGEVRFPFGYGLSYTTYEYSNLKITEPYLENGIGLKVSVNVKNTGSVAGKEIVEVYIKKMYDTALGNNKPIRQLKGFAKISLEPDETKTVTIDVPIKELAFWSNFYQKLVVKEGKYLIEAGGSSQHLPCTETITVAGKWKAKLHNVYTDLSRYCYNVGETGKVKVAATKEDRKHLSDDEIEVIYSIVDDHIADVSTQGIITAKNTGVTELCTTVVCEGISKTSKRPIVVR